LYLRVPNECAAGNRGSGILLAQGCVILARCGPLPLCPLRLSLGSFGAGPSDQVHRAYAS